MAYEENPYAPPAELCGSRHGGVRSGRRTRTLYRRLQCSQKLILVCILLYFNVQPSRVALTRYPGGAQYSVYIAAVALVVVLVAMVSVVRLAIRVYSVASGILLGIGTLIPCFGLLILLMIV